MEKISKENQKWSQKLGTSALTNVNVLQSNLDIFGTESVMVDGSELTVTINKSENRVTTETITLATTK